MVTEHRSRRRRYNKSILERVIYQHYNLHHGSEEIARQLNMSRRAVQRTLQHWREIGLVRLPYTPSFRPKTRVLNTQQVKVNLPKFFQVQGLNDPVHVGAS